MGNWNEESIIEALVKNFGKGREEETLTDLREEIEGSLDLKKRSILGLRRRREFYGGWG